MNAFHRFLYISSISKFFMLLTLILLLTNAAIVNAQNNANNANGNVANSNVNSNANGNANQNTNGNTNARPNSNTDPNANGNTNVNNNTNQNNNNNGNKNYNSGEEGRRDKLSDSNWFYFIVTLMFLGLIAPFVWIIVRSIKFSGSTYRSTLGLPEGSFRAILAYTLVAFLGFYVLASILSLSYFNPPDFLLGIVATVIGFYFGSRTAEDRSAGSRTVGIIQGSVKDKNGTAAVGATVDLSQSGAKKFTQNASTSGDFKFDNVPVGDYDIQASLAGHTPSDIVKVKVTTGATPPVNLSLK